MNCICKNRGLLSVCTVVAVAVLLAGNLNQIAVDLPNIVCDFNRQSRYCT